MAQSDSSIRQNLAVTGPSGLPDFRNPGVVLRILLAANAFGLLTAAMGEVDSARWSTAFVDLAMLLEPTLLLLLSVTGIFSVQLAHLSLQRGAFTILLLAELCLVAVIWFLSHNSTLEIMPASATRAALWTAIATAAIGGWLHLLQLSRSPALAEARLMALSARIRPHFLFNSLNGILGIIRNDPRRAEKALEELAELFRALMQDPRELVPLSEEIALCRQYIELERLRLGERVRVNWDIEHCPPDALMPPLMLQPLLENAVYHGIEPASEPGVIDIKLVHTGNSIVIMMSNPNEAGHVRSQGNQMAIANIRERLLLFYDLAASLEAELRDGHYSVRIVLPYQKRK